MNLITFFCFVFYTFHFHSMFRGFLIYDPSEKNVSFLQHFDMNDSSAIHITPIILPPI